VIVLLAAADDREAEVAGDDRLAGVARGSMDQAVPLAPTDLCAHSERAFRGSAVEDGTAEVRDNEHGFREARVVAACLDSGLAEGLEHGGERDDVQIVQREKLLALVVEDPIDNPLFHVDVDLFDWQGQDDLGWLFWAHVEGKDRLCALFAIGIDRTRGDTSDAILEDVGVNRDLSRLGQVEEPNQRDTL